MKTTSETKWHVYSAGCSWHGTIDQVGKTPPSLEGHSLPCCPFCYSVLFQTPEDEWWKGAQQHQDARGHTNYVDFLKWIMQQKRCWKTLRSAALEFEKKTGRKVSW